MRTQKVQNPLFVTIIVFAVVILFSFLVIGFNRMTARAQGNLALFSNANQEPSEPRSMAREPVTDGQQEFKASLTYQDVYTNPNVLDPAGVESQEGQLEVVGDLTIESTLSGSEHIPASAFRSDGYPGAAVGYRFSVLGGTFPGGYVRNISADFVCMAAPVYLPDGATVTEFSIFFMDDHPTYDMYEVRLWRKNHASPGNAADKMVDLDFPGVDDRTIRRGSTTDIASGTAVVSNDYGYYITFCFFPNTGLQNLVYGFRVDYNP